MSRIVSIYIISLLCLIFYSSCLFSQETAPIRIAYNQNNPPYKFISDKGEASGILMDIWRKWSETTGVPLVFIDAPFVETVNMVRDGRADLHAGLFESLEREAFFDFTDPIFNASYYMMYHKNLLGIRSVSDLSGYLVGVPEGGFTDRYMQSHYPELTLKRYDDYPSLFKAALNGEIKVFIAPIENLNQYMKSSGFDRDFRYQVDKPLFSQQYRGAIAKGNEQLLQTLNRGLKDIPPNEFAEIEKKWLGISRTHKIDEGLIISMDMDKQPYEFVNPYGMPDGILVEYWKLWSKTTGRKVSFLPGTTTDAIQAVIDGMADFHIGLPASEYAKEKLVFSDPFYQKRSSLFHLSNISYPSDITQLENLVIGVVQNTIEDDYCVLNLPVSCIIRRFSSLSEMAYAILSNDIDVMLADSQVGKLLLMEERLAGQIIAEPPTFTSPLLAGVLENNKSILETINRGIENIPLNELDNIERRWISDQDQRFWLTEKQEASHDYAQMLTEVEEKWIQDHPVIRVGVDPGFEPFEFINEAGNHDGLASDYIKLINERCGTNLQVVPYPTWSEVIEKTKKREIDVLCAVMPTEARKEYLNFTQPYITSPEMIFTRKDAPFIGGVDDLRGKVIALKSKSYMQERLERHYPFLKLKLYNSTYDAIEAVSKGEADAYINTLAHGAYVVSQYNFTNVVVAAPMDGMIDGISFAIRNDWPILFNIISKALSSVSEDKAAELRSKWITVRFEHSREARRILFWGSIAFVLLIALIIAAFLWNRTLKYEINRRKEMEISLREAKEQAESADRLKSAFLASMSHELRTPLNSIIGFTGILLQELPGPMNPEQKKQLGMVKASSKHLLSLINDILDISKIEAGQLQIVESEFYLSDSVQKVIQSIIPLAKKKDLDVTFKISENIGAIVSDSRRIEQILLNLLSNAVKFTETGGISLNVKLHTPLTSPTKKVIEFSVIDTGIGIKDEDLDKLFKPFQQVETGLTRKYEGTGLGLSICDKLVNLLGGKITVNSQWGKGTTMSFTIAYKAK